MLRPGLLRVEALSLAVCFIQHTLRPGGEAVPLHGAYRPVRYDQILDHVEHALRGDTVIHQDARGHAPRLLYESYQQMLSADVVELEAACHLPGALERALSLLSKSLVHTTSSGGAHSSPSPSKISYT